MKLYYDYADKHIGTNIEDILEVGRKPKWFLDTSPIIFDKVSKYEFIDTCPDHLLYNYESFSTIKSCPAVNKHFSNSILLKFPCDVILDIREDGCTFKGSNKDVLMNVHAPEQAPKYISDNWFIIKFNLNLSLRTEKENKAIFINPLMWKHQNYHVSPGIWESGDITGPNLLNVIVFFEKTTFKKYFFKRNDPLAVLQFYDRIDSLEKEDHSHFIEKRHNGIKSFFNAPHKE